MGILLFNWLGYRLFNSIAENDAARRLEARLDRQQYDDNQLVSIKVPLTHLTYYNTSTSFERANGEIDLDGIPYHYVKRRIYNDSLEMLCIPNTTELKLRKSCNDYFGLVNGLGQASKPGLPLHSTKSFSIDPYLCTECIKMPVLPCIVLMHGEIYADCFPSLSLPTDERPPACRIA